ncbi:MAG: hypothetical protein KatS3mg035_1098 [Bacteroidia bacterium]|nr:MAG: hypothetical protein KatS3mg035_1098 [Bacteroidia bacterium]
MNIRTGQTVYEQVWSFDVDNNPVTGATFDYVLYLDNIPYTGSSPSYSLTDVARGIFTFSWSADTIGMYQLYAKNNSTGVVFISETINVRPDSEFGSTIYIGL